jgi:hypothetical protein
MCSAGQVFEGTAVVFQAGLNPVDLATPFIVSEPVSVGVSTVSSRGPPSLR